LIGDFREDHTFWTTIGQIVVGFIPYAGQVADVRDLIAALNRIINEGGWRSGWEWLNLILILIAFVPGLGDIIKGLGRAGIRWLRRTRFIGRLIEAISRNVIQPALRHVVYPAVGYIKRQIRQLVDAISERINRTLQARRARMAARAERRQLQSAIDDAEKAGRINVNPTNRSWIDSDPRNRELSYDPDRRGISDSSVQEARAALDAESQGLVNGAIRRDPAGGADFIDAAGTFWGHERPRGINIANDADSIVETLTRKRQSVLLDASEIDRGQQSLILGLVEQELRSQGLAQQTIQELMNHIIVVRPRVNPGTVRAVRIGIERATEEDRQSAAEAR
jgi:hypothetical protein